MDTSEAKRLKALEEENRKLKKLLVENFKRWGKRFGTSIFRKTSTTTRPHSLCDRVARGRADNGWFAP